MIRSFRSLAASILLAGAITLLSIPASAQAKPARSHSASPLPPQETGFLNRKIEINGTVHRYQVYLPEEWRRDDHKKWPVILFLHGRGERGAEGMWQTQIGLPQAVRDHPERWPFVIVMPQCPLGSYWTDPEMLTLALTSLDRETAEFHLDPERTYLSGLSMGGYGAWELGRLHPQRWAAVAIAAGGVFWSYAPDRWQQAATLPADYARPLLRTPIWLFHGTDDNVVAPRQSELMLEAFKGAGGHLRLWLYQGLRHDCWSRAYNEPELPIWLLAHHGLAQQDSKAGAAQELTERLLIPFHPPVIKLTIAQMDALAGEYVDARAHPVVSVYRQGNQLFEKNQQGEVAELGAESPTILFYLYGSSTTRITFQRDAQGHIIALVLKDDRHEERWEKRGSVSSRQSSTQGSDQAKR